MHNLENHITESENDVKTTTLQELVVTSDYVRVDGEKFVFVPRKNEKNLATDAISLIENMHYSCALCGQRQHKKPNWRQRVNFHQRRSSR